MSLEEGLFEEVDVEGGLLELLDWMLFMKTANSSILKRLLMSWSAREEGQGRGELEFRIE